MGKGKSKLHNFSVTQYVINLRLAPEDLRLDIRDFACIFERYIFLAL